MIPLPRHEVFRTTDLDEARFEVGRIFCPHRLELVGRNTGLAAVQTARRLESVTLSYLDYGDTVRILPGELQNFFLVQMPMEGHSTIRCGRDVILSHAGCASVPTPTLPLAMQWEQGCRQLIVKIDRVALETHLAAMLGRTVDRPIRFELGMDLTAAAGRSWVNLISALQNELESDGLLLQQPMAARSFESLIMTTLLLGQANNFSAALHAAQAPAETRAVRRAVGFIEEHPDQPLTVEKLARVAGTSVRSLQDGFQRQLATTPTAYLRDVRLERVRSELRGADVAAGASVTAVASRWGFVHLGRFAAAYRRRFGEAPSRTLRR